MRGRLDNQLRGPLRMRSEAGDVVATLLGSRRMLGLGLASVLLAASCDGEAASDGGAQVTAGSAPSAGVGAGGLGGAAGAHAGSAAVGGSRPQASAGAGSGAGAGTSAADAGVSAQAGVGAAGVGASGSGAGGIGPSGCEPSSGAASPAMPGSAGAAAGTAAAGSGGSASAGTTSAAGGGANEPCPPVGGAPAAAGSGAAGSGTAPGGVADYSDSFDDVTALDASRYPTVMPSCSGTGTLALDTAVGHSGSQSLRVNGAGGYCNHVFFQVAALGPMLPDPVYVRVFVKAAMPLGAGHTTFAAMHDMREDKDLRLGGQNEVLVWNRESDDATLPELSPTGVGLSKALGTDTWQCLEWMIDSSKRELRTWLDDAEVPGLVLDAEPTADVDRQWQRKPDWQPTLLDLRLGWESYGDQALTLWFDDLAVGKTRIGCGP